MWHPRAARTAFIDQPHGRIRPKRWTSTSEKGTRPCWAKESAARPPISGPALHSADPDLVEIAVRAPDATLCLTTALSRHNLIDDIPATIDAASPRQQRAPRTTAPVTWRRFEEETFDIGRDELAVYDELAVGIYNPARSVIDFRLRHLYGEDQAVEAIRRWLANPGNHPAELLAIARHSPP